MNSEDSYWQIFELEAKNKEFAEQQGREEQV